MIVQCFGNLLNRGTRGPDHGPVVISGMLRLARLAVNDAAIASHPLGR